MSRFGKGRPSRTGRRRTKSRTDPVPGAQTPAHLEVRKERAEDVRVRIADWITRLAGSVWFVYAGETDTGGNAERVPTAPA
ncbi:hypothetical protein [Streptomyces sp. NBC_00847]|uniref:hypothetical protein n=1 Tax=unclassified Streptomyces TaxID=2593676 RepID=UPI002255518D|nr:hypothetical protein [Streptomyces sp. NBC_00847]MCX4879045.1 hypothetical protein [Streptomyces sp. NBC_00847]